MLDFVDCSWIVDYGPSLIDPRQGGGAMLVLTRKSNQSIMIGDDIELAVLSIMGDKVRIGIDASREIPVFRKEVYLEIQQENAAARASARAEVDDALNRLSASP
jgi:carbon storage regulator